MRGSVNTPGVSYPEFITELDKKAPAGYGLNNDFTAISEDGQTSDVSDLDSFMTTRWVRYVNNAEVSMVENFYIYYALIRVDSYSVNDYVVQTCFPIASTYNGCRLQRVYRGGAWSEWEWVNPPMVPGVEYRTTERWRKLPVYTKLVDFGSLPATSVSSISVGVSGIDLCYVIGSAFNGTTNECIPIPSGSSGVYAAYFYVSSNGSLSVRTMQDMSGYSGVFVLRYVKD